MLNLSAQMRREIAARFQAAMAPLPAKRREVEARLALCDEEQALCLQFLYGFLPVADILSFAPRQLEGYVTAALTARKGLAYGPAVPAELFFNYVLMPRVNNEYLDLSRETLQAALWQRVQGKSMADAALEVNYWCLEQATYHPSDDRTLGPLAVMKGAFGRCGEESTLAVCALRSAGIPARQCYVPRWSHCDDNHAWVEVWAGDGWHYLGACEPEPVLDKGWFTAAASRAMVVHSTALSTLVTGPFARQIDGRRTLIHSTDAYAPCVTLEVLVTCQGVPAEGVEVQFQLVNASECFSIYQGATDSRGRVCFSTGRGGLRLHICHQGNLLSRVVDTRRETRVTLDLNDARLPQQLQGTAECFDLTPPAERTAQPLPARRQQAHLQRTVACDSIRRARVEAFAGHPAGGNRPEVERFLADNRFSPQEKAQLLATLRPKDLLDCTAEMLADTLLCARPYGAQLDEECYRAWVLTPRVANEMLLPVRTALRAQAPRDLRDGEAVLAWLQSRMTLTDDDGLPELVPDCAKALAHGCIPKSAFGVLFVNLCRALGIPARQNPNTLAFEWLEQGRFCPIDAPTAPETLPLHLTGPAGQALAYGERFTLSRLTRRGYQTLAYDGLVLQGRHTFALAPGQYALTTTTRQIDGTISVRLCHFSMETETTLVLILPEDQTASRIHPRLLALPEGPIRTALAQSREPRLLLVLEPGKEPTEHLLQELLDCREALGHHGLLLMTGSGGDARNATLQRVLAALPQAVLLQADDDDGLQALRQTMGVGDERLPFSLAVDGRGRGLYACANYNIHTAQTLLNIQQLAKEKEFA